MCKQFLVPENVLVSVDAEVAEKVLSVSPPVAIDISHVRYGKEFLRFMLFTNWPYLLGDDAPKGEDHRLYNRYYWFTKFSRLFASVHGRERRAGAASLSNT